MTYTVYDTEDSSWHRSGLTHDEAQSLCDERNRENSRRGDRYAVVSDSELRDQIARPEDRPE